MAKCVEITMDDNGAITVQECEPREEGENEGNPPPVQVKSLEEAFKATADIMSQTPESMDEEAGFNSMFDKQGA